MIKNEVLAYLTQYSEKKHRPDTLAKHFGLTQAAMKVVLLDLGDKIERGDDGHRTLYFVPSPELIALRAVNEGKPRRTHAKPMVQSKAMTDALERCKELYPNGGNFKSVS